MKTNKFGKVVKVVALVMATLVFFTSGDISAKAVEGNTVEEQAYNFMKKEMGITNNAALAGVLASMEQNAAYDPKAHVTDAYGDRYGLCLWYGNRLKGLLKFCRNNNYDWQSSEGQLRYMKYELDTYFRNVNGVLHNNVISQNQDYNFPDSADGAESFETFFAIQYVRKADNAAACSEGNRAKVYTYDRVKGFGSAAAPAVNTAATPAPATPAPATPAPATATPAAPAPATPTPAAPTQPATSAQPAAPAKASNALTLAGNTVEEKVFLYMRNDCKIMNDAAIAGMLANIENVSGFNPNNSYTDANGERYGLLGWYGSRLSNLKSYCNSLGYDWHTADAQIMFMVYEWPSYFGNVNRVLRNVTSDPEFNFPDSADGAYNFGMYLSLQYVKDNKGNKPEDRARDYFYSRVKSMSGR